MPGVAPALAAAVLMAALSTLADLLWAVWSLQHRMVFGLIHGGVLFVFLGIFLGAWAGGRKAVIGGALGQLGVGVLAAASFYLFAPLLGWNAMLAAWGVLWLGTAELLRRVGRSRGGGRRRDLLGHGGALARGLLAAVLSGMTFQAILGIWLQRQPGGAVYGWNFIAWLLAFAPALLALMTGLERNRRGRLPGSGDPEPRPAG